MNIRSQESRVAYEGEHVMRDGTVHDKVWAVETKARNGKMKLVWYTDKEEFTKAISGKAEFQSFPAVFQVHVDGICTIANVVKAIARNIRVAANRVDPFATVPKQGIRQPQFSVVAANHRVRDGFKHAV